MLAAHLDFGASMGWFEVLILCSCWVCNPATTPNSKHVGIHHHFIRKRVANDELKVVYVPPKEQHADFLTKPLHQGAFEVH